MSDRKQLLKRLRANIDAHYRRAIAALDVLASYPDDDNAGEVPAETVRQKRNPDHRPKKAAAQQNSHRDIVLGALGPEYQTVNELAARTGLKAEKVRAVLYAPSLTGQFKKKKIGKVARFKRLETGRSKTAGAA